MVILPMLLAAAVAAAPAPKKAASWSELSAWVLREGKEDKIGPKTASSLGLSAAALAVKKVWFEQEHAADGLGRAMSVSSDGEGRSEWLIIQVEKATTTAEGKTLDAYGFRLDAGGKLKAVMSVTGVVGRLKHGQPALDAEETKERLARESKFWREKAMRLPLRLE